MNKEEFDAIIKKQSERLNPKGEYQEAARDEEIFFAAQLKPKWDQFYKIKRKQLLLDVAEWKRSSDHADLMEVIKTATQTLRAAGLSLKEVKKMFKDYKVNWVLDALDFYMALDRNNTP